VVHTGEGGAGRYLQGRGEGWYLKERGGGGGGTTR
jgi:hypothetical protein